MMVVVAVVLVAALMAMLMFEVWLRHMRGANRLKCPRCGETDFCTDTGKKT